MLHLNEFLYSAFGKPTQQQANLSFLFFESAFVQSKCKRITVIRKTYLKCIIEVFISTYPFVNLETSFNVKYSFISRMELGCQLQFFIRLIL